jgi:hypothetical protein
MTILDAVDWPAVREHHEDRVRVHKELRRLYRKGAHAHFADVGLGIPDDDLNYSAREHGLGPKILALNVNAEQRSLT